MIILQKKISIFWTVLFLLIHKLKSLKFSKKVKIIDAFDIEGSLKERIESIREEAETAVRQEARLVLSDKYF